MIQPKERKWQQTDHPLLLEAAAGQLLTCNRGEKCGFWVTGFLRHEAESVPGNSDSANLILTAAGCRSCDKVQITQGDIGVVQDAGLLLSEIQKPTLNFALAAARSKLTELGNNLLQREFPL